MLSTSVSDFPERAWIYFGDEYDVQGEVAFKSGIVDGGQVTVPDFHLWNPRPQHTQDELAVSLSSVVVSPGYDVQYVPVLKLGTYDVQLDRNTAPQLNIDPRPFEDLGSYEISASAWPQDSTHANIEHMSWQSVSVTPTALPLIPASRNATCATWQDSNGWVWQPRCGETNGSAAAYGSPRTDIVIDLGQQTMVSAVSLIDVLPNVANCTVDVELGAMGTNDWQQAGDFVVNGSVDVTGSVVHDLATPHLRATCTSFSETVALVTLILSG